MEEHIYCLFHGFYSDRSLWGVFSTLDAAMAEHDRFSASEGSVPAHSAAWSVIDEDPTERHWMCEFGKDRTTFGCPFDIQERILDRSAAHAATASPTPR